MFRCVIALVSVIATALILVIATALPAWAADDGTVSVPLRGDNPQGAEAREDALARGLEQVIARVTGESDVASVSGADKVLEQPQRWLLRYSYEQGDPPRLKAVFDADALSRHLNEQGASVWSGSRPPVLVWLVDQGTGQGSMVAEGDDLGEQLASVAGRRGVTLTLPKWDSRDRDTVAVSDVRGRFDEPVAEASRRYDTPWVATAVIYEGGDTTVNWRLLNEGEAVAANRDQAGDTDQALSLMLEAIGDEIVARYSSGAGEAAKDSGGGLIRGGDLVTVKGVRALGDWQALEGRLARLGSMRGVALRAVSDDRVQFDVEYGGGDSELKRALEGLDRLETCADEGGQDTGPLTFCLR